MIALIQANPETPATQGLTTTQVQIAAGALCVIIVAIIILRRKRKKKTEDEF